MALLADNGGVRALISVSDRSGAFELARRLVALGWKIVSSGGTAGVLRGGGLAVTEVAEMTGAPEMLSGRVKTLHPLIHGGILADRSRPQHLADLAAAGGAPIDLVVCNLYPFASAPSVEMIDIGGPAMVRAAAKNHAHVGVVVDPDDYGAVLDELESEGALSDALRHRLARKAFAHCSDYDAAIAAWLDAGALEALPESLTLRLRRAEVLRYGENPHQAGGRYRQDGAASWWDSASQLGGKQLSYLNVFDADAAWRLVNSLGADPAAVVVKHANPCGAAAHDDLAEAYRRAHACDPVSAFGGVVALNRPVTEEVAESLAEVFTEVVVAPDYEESALAQLQASPNLRILQAQAPEAAGLQLRSLGAAFLVQTAPAAAAEGLAESGIAASAGAGEGVAGWSVVSERSPTEDEWRDLVFAWRVVAAVSSNAIVVAKDRCAVGIGAGQQNRRDAGRIAAAKAGDRAQGGAYASDAFFPFADGLDGALEAGCTAVIQPGGSRRDGEVIEAADRHGLAMVFTGRRTFRH
ncbi:MAG: bifunctional phosphoribosylaminoimidazolecarboxamide formyltransferase/IMP cyclohydrolase [Acidimicrobiia bacterium]|nr:bifunctional phosphoribosylaminoimidazolecarboxamide formyltransferase/IMP cyclohydrolase [Acidimicrobiia bacterium]